nr:hypothetical protein [candidate division KSB1 bacterium]
GIDLSGAFVLQDGTFERFFGGTTNAGLLYRIPNTVMLLKAGWSYFGGGDSDGGNLDTTGPYLGFATMLRIAGHLGIRVDLSGHHFERRGSVPDRVLGLKFSVGLTFLPKLSN